MSVTFKVNNVYPADPETQFLRSGNIDNCYGTCFEMIRKRLEKFLSGFFALGVNTRGEIYPEIGWLIQDMDAELYNIEVPINFINCAKHGEKRNSALDRYHIGSGVACDMCRTNLRDEPCISYRKNSDLCVPCYEKITKILSYKEENVVAGTVECDICKDIISMSDKIVCDTHINIIIDQRKIKNLCSSCYDKLEANRNFFLFNSQHCQIKFEHI